MTEKRELEAARRVLLAAVPAGSRVLCAVSGGLDSMCLLHFLAAWGRTRNVSLCAAHFNHQLRGADADRDEAFVRELCGTWGIPLTVGRGDVRALAARERLSEEEAARQLRYTFLRETAAREDCALLLTAHHADDNAETLLLNLIRGTGLKGLAGIPQERDGILRPFLGVSRGELADYASAHGIPHVEDATNADPDAATRNFIRLRVMPLLRELNPRAPEAMSRTAEQLRELDGELDRLADALLCRAQVETGRVAITLSLLTAAPKSVQFRVLLGLFDRLGVGRKDVGAVHLGAIRCLMSAPSGKTLSLPHGVTARCFRGRLFLEIREPPPESVTLEPNRPLRFGAYTLTLLDRREGSGLALRPGAEALRAKTCRGGERLALPGTNGGRRSVKRLCLDRGIPPEKRECLPAVYAGDRLAAVWRLGVDRNFLPEGEPCRFIQIINITEERDHEK